MSLGTKLWNTSRQDSAGKGPFMGKSWEPSSTASLSVFLLDWWCCFAIVPASIGRSLSVYRFFSLPEPLELRVIFLFFTLFRVVQSIHFTSPWGESCLAPQLSVLFLPLSSVLQLLFMLPHVSGMLVPHPLCPLGLNLNVTSSRDCIFHRIPWSFHFTFSYFIFFTQWHSYVCSCVFCNAFPSY